MIAHNNGLLGIIIKVARVDIQKQYFNMLKIGEFINNKIINILELMALANYLKQHMILLNFILLHFKQQVLLVLKFSNMFNKNQ